MQNKTIESKQSLTESDAFYHWMPYVVAGIIFAAHLIAGVIREDVWIVFGGQMLSLAVFLALRMAFPRSP